MSDRVARLATWPIYMPGGRDPEQEFDGGGSGAVPTGVETLAIKARRYNQSQGKERKPGMAGRQANANPERSDKKRVAKSLNDWGAVNDEST
ncbi:hypothetical protein [Methylobacter marinus]|uniref:hypothetical protein n=1 Tax=Methylobacter marinus TaxID=34058 RepID=UPI00035EAB1C|nr:hypothetical protein [Methylobacter marinus]